MSSALTKLADQGRLERNGRGWVLRGVNGMTGDGTSDFVLPATASPRDNGTYVVADGVSGVTQVGDWDAVWDFLDLNSTLWDSSGTREPGQVFHVTRTTTFRWMAKDIKGNESTGSDTFVITGSQ